MAATEQPPAPPRLKPGTVFAPVAWEPADASAFQALARGEADAEQQRRVLAWVIERAAATYEFHYRESERDTAFALGRAFVGQQIRKLLIVNVSMQRG